jgi:hypothetical protein
VEPIKVRGRTVLNRVDEGERERTSAETNADGSRASADADRIQKGTSGKVGDCHASGARNIAWLAGGSNLVEQDVVMFALLRTLALCGRCLIVGRGRIVADTR